MFNGTGKEKNCLDFDAKHWGKIITKKRETESNFGNVDFNFLFAMAATFSRH
jgi:hypothetical protein